MKAAQQPPGLSISATRRAFGIGTFRYSAIELLVAILILLVSSPFVDSLPQGDLIEAGLLSLVMISALFAVGGRRRTMIQGLILLAPALVFKWFNHLAPNTLHPVFFLVPSAIFFGFVVIRLLSFIWRALRVDANVLCAGIAGFLLVGLSWLPLYTLAGRLDPAAFAISSGPGTASEMQGFTAFYFSFVTLSTVGYGDVTPVSKFARMLAVTEAVTGMFYMAVMISRLVSSYSTTPHNAGGSDDHRAP